MKIYDIHNPCDLYILIDKCDLTPVRRQMKMTVREMAMATWMSSPVRESTCTGAQHLNTQFTFLDMMFCKGYPNVQPR